MRLELIPARWLEYEPPGNCHDFGIGETIAAISAAAAATVPEAAAAGTTAALGTGGLYAAGEAAASALPSLSTIGAVTGGVGTLLSAKAGLDNADYQAAVARSEAAAQKQKANEDAAAGERAQITQDRKTALVQSRAQALAASSGTDATSPDVLTTEGRIAQQGSYNALSSLYEGQSRARSDSYQADIDLFKGNQIEQAAPLAATGTILSGISGFADKRARLRAFTSNPDAGFFNFGAT